MLTAVSFLCFATLWASAFQRALDSSASWVMERRLAEGARTLVSSGRVDCVAQSGIVWRVEAPFPSTVAMTRERMVFTDEDGVRTKALADLPHYAEIREQTDSFAAGDEKAFDGLFDLRSRENAEGGWVVDLTPVKDEMKQLFTRIELSGARFPTNAVFFFQSGGSSTIRLRSVPRVR